MAEEISSEAKKGTFDCSSRLRCRIVCEKCGFPARRYIEYLKLGEFEVGQAERIVVAYPGQYYLLSYETETVTPIFITLKCERCGFEKKITDPVLTVEYLKSSARHREPVRLYV